MTKAEIKEIVKTDIIASICSDDFESAYEKATDEEIKFYYQEFDRQLDRIRKYLFK